MAKGYLLSEEQWQLLRELFAREKQAHRNTRNRPFVPVEDLPAPEVYLALTPYTIAGRSGMTVSSAECDVYSIIDGTLTAISDLTRIVYNPYLTAIPGGLIIKTARDKFGRWLAECPCDDTPLDTGTDAGTATATSPETGTSTSTADDSCQCEEFPDYFVLHFTGFSGTCAPLNGYYKYIRSGSSCTYVVSRAGYTGTLTLNSSGAGNTWVLTHIHTASGSSVTYRGTTSDQDCCRDMTLVYTSGNCSPHPASVILWPGTPCPSPTGTGGTGTFDTGTGDIDIVTGTGGGPFSDCCSGNLPYTMTVTFTDVLGCACLNGASTTLTYTGSGVWAGTLVACSGESLIQVSCISANNLGIVMSGACTLAGTAVAATCSPFSYSGNHSISGCCGGTVTFTLTP